MLNNNKTLTSETLSKASQTYTEVTEMVRALADDPQLANELQSELHNKEILHHLFGLRSASGLSQEQMAERLHCSQSKISKFENASDSDINMGELDSYLDALDRGVMLLIYKRGEKAMDQIRFHASMIKHCLNHMVRLAGSDDEIQSGVTNAHLDTLVDLVKVVIDSASKLPNFKIELPPLLEADESRIISDCPIETSVIH